MADPTHPHSSGKWQPTPVFLPGKFHGQGAFRATVCGAAKSWTRQWLSDWAFPLIISPLLGWKLFMIWTMWIDCTFCSQCFLSSLPWLWLTVGIISSQVVLVVKNLPANAGDIRDTFDPWVKKILWRRKWQPTPVFLPVESHGQRSLVSYSP